MLYYLMRRVAQKALTDAAILFLATMLSYFVRVNVATTESMGMVLGNKPANVVSLPFWGLCHQVRLEIRVRKRRIGYLGRPQRCTHHCFRSGMAAAKAAWASEASNKGSVNCLQHALRLAEFTFSGTQDGNGHGQLVSTHQEGSS